MKSCQSPSRMNSGNSVLQLRSLRSGTGSIWRITTDIKTSADSVAFVTCAWCELALGAIGGSACSGVLEQMPIELHGAGLRVSVPLKDVRPWCLTQGVWLWQFCQKHAGSHFVELWQCSSAPPSTKEQIIGPPAGLMLSYSPVQLSSCNAHFPSISSHSWGCADRHSKPSQIAFKDAPPSWRSWSPCATCLGCRYRVTPPAVSRTQNFTAMEPKKVK